MRPRTNIVAVIIFFTLALLPVIFCAVDGLWPIQGRAEPNARAAFPDKLSSKTFRMFSDWFNDVIRLRFRLITAVGDFSRVLGLPATPKVLIRPSGWLFYTD